MKNIVLLILLFVTCCFSNLSYLSKKIPKKEIDIKNSPLLIQKKLNEKKETTSVTISKSESTLLKTNTIKKSKNLNKNKQNFISNQPVSVVKTLPTHEEERNSKFYRINNIQCSNTTCRSPNARCEDASTCMCLEGWANFNKEQKGNPLGLFCQYEQKGQITAFLLEFFLCFGVGHFYTGRIIHGVIKLIVLISGLVLAFIFKKSNSEIEEDSKLNFSFFKGVGLIVTFIFISYAFFHLVDIILYASNKLSDGNGVPLKAW